MNALSPPTREFDLVIAGGAMAGATLALAIEHYTKSGLKVAVVEAFMPNKSHPGFDSRSIALAYGSTLLLEKMGLWKHLSPHATPINSVHVSDSGHFGLTDIDARNENVPYLGSVIELAKAGEIFHQLLTRSKQITLLCPASVEHIDRQQIDTVKLTLSSGQILNTKLLIAADGAMSTCCNMLGITEREHDFKQVAVIANITTAIAHQNRAFERFTEQGPIALLPMSQGRSSLVWCVNQAQARRLLTLDNTDFIDELQHAFGWRLGQLFNAGQRHHYPLILRQATQLVSHRFAIVGNAAQSLHPIAGQGFNLGLRDVFTLAEEIAHSYQSGYDIGEMKQLQRYVKRREPDRNATVAMTSALVYGFSNASLPLIFGRNLGLTAMTICPQLLHPLRKRAMGLLEIGLLEMDLVKR